MLKIRVLLIVLSLCALGCAGFGATPDGERLARMQASPQWGQGEFVNPQPLWNNLNYTTLYASIDNRSAYGAPEDVEKDIPVVHGDGSRFNALPTSGLRVTWLGHSTLLIEIDGARVLTDPIWTNAGPYNWLGPSRWYEPPVALENLPKIDAVVISHDHYDHLDSRTVEVLMKTDVTFFVPLGVGAHLELWGVSKDRIVELDWWERGNINGLDIVCTPSRHASGRGLFDRNGTLWSGWALIGPEHRAFFSGDTGLFEDMKRIGQELGPFDVTMIESGAYGDNWPDWHIGPEQAVLAHQWLRGKYMIPVHWGLFTLAFHGWTAPAERVWAAAHKAQIALGIPRPGQSIEPENPPDLERWWPEVPFKNAQQDPINSTAVNGRPARAN